MMPEKEGGMERRSDERDLGNKWDERTVGKLGPARVPAARTHARAHAYAPHRMWGP